MHYTYEGVRPQHPRIPGQLRKPVACCSLHGGGRLSKRPLRKDSMLRPNTAVLFIYKVHNFFTRIYNHDVPEDRARQVKLKRMTYLRASLPRPLQAVLSHITLQFIYIYIKVTPVRYITARFHPLWVYMMHGGAHIVQTWCMTFGIFFYPRSFFQWLSVISFAYRRARVCALATRRIYLLTSIIYIIWRTALSRTRRAHLSSDISTPH